MSLDDYQEPKGAYFTPALIARFEDGAAAEAAIDSLRDAGFTTRDIQVGRGRGHWHRHGEEHQVTVIVSEPTPGMLAQARALLAASAATEVEPYGAGA
jgi:hypothetical protein